MNIYSPPKSDAREVPTLTAGTRLQGGENGGGVVSMLATDQAGDVWGIAPRASLLMQTHGAVRLEQGVLIGGDIVILPPEEGPNSVTDTLGRFRVSLGTFVLPSAPGGDALGVPISADDAHRRIASRIDAPFRTARVTRFLATLSLSLNGARQRLNGAIELRPQGEEPFAQRGDAGILLVVGEWRPLGVLLARRGDIFVAAPIAEWLEAEGLTPLSDTAATRHNAKVTAPFFNPKDVDRRLAATLEVFGDSKPAGQEPTVSARMVDEVATLATSLPGYNDEHSDLAEAMELL